MNPIQGLSNSSNVRPFSGAANDPFSAGAANRMNGVDDFLKHKCSPEAGDLQDLIKKLIPLLQQLLQQQPGAATPPGGADGAGAAPGEKKAKGAKGAKGGKKAKGGKGGSKGGVKVDGPEGFLWKPVSDSNGKLVTLLPKNLAGKVQSVEIQDANGKVLDKGRAAGIGNGDRPHFRFDKPGAAYGDNLRVVARLADGTTTSWPVGQGGVRHD